MRTTRSRIKCEYVRIVCERHANVCELVPDSRVIHFLDSHLDEGVLVCHLRRTTATKRLQSAQRSLSMIAKNLDGTIPEVQLTDADEALIDAAGESLLSAVRDLLDQQAFNKALETIWTVISDANVYIDAQAPWTLKKTDPERMAAVLYTVVETVRRVALAT